jgi:hypothetical protein
MGFSSSFPSSVMLLMVSTGALWLRGLAVWWVMVAVASWVLRGA